MLVKIKTIDDNREKDATLEAIFGLDSFVYTHRYGEPREGDSRRSNFGTAFINPEYIISIFETERTVAIPLYINGRYMGRYTAIGTFKYYYITTVDDTYTMFETDFNEVKDALCEKVEVKKFKGNDGQEEQGGKKDGVESGDIDPENVEGLIREVCKTIKTLVETAPFV